MTSHKLNKEMGQSQTTANPLAHLWTLIENLTSMYVRTYERNTISSIPGQLSASD